MCLAMSPFACSRSDLHRWHKIQDFLVWILPSVNRAKSSTFSVHYSKRGYRHSDARARANPTSRQSRFSPIASSNGAKTWQTDLIKVL
jgi:hypothetical protein